MNTGGPVTVVGARIVNLSPYGMLIRSPLPMEREAVHRFRLVIGAESRDVEARVAMCQPDGRRRYDVGREFVAPAEELRARLTQALAGS
jgi:hypothetical protein